MEDTTQRDIELGKKLTSDIGEVILNHVKNNYKDRMNKTQFATLFYSTYQICIGTAVASKITKSEFITMTSVLTELCYPDKV